MEQNLRARAVLTSLSRVLMSDFTNHVLCMVNVRSKINGILPPDFILQMRFIGLSGNAMKRNMPFICVCLSAMPIFLPGRVQSRPQPYTRALS